jgi:pimeloyl-ACP methyl ester carboxylesterase
MRLIKTFEVLFLVGAILIGAGVALWLSIWSPGALIRDPLPLYRQASATVTADETGKRDIQDVRLVDPDGNVVSFSISLPKGGFADEAGEKLPALVVISGFRSARDNLKYIPEPGPNAIISYDYPYNSQEWKAASLVGRIMIARRVAFRLPNDVAGLMAWIRRQHWADQGRISLAGVSLGAIALPVIRRRASATGQTDGPSVIAYGGVGLQTLTAANLELSPDWLRELAAWGISLALRPLEPATHLSEISGPFLLINGRDDERLPAESIRRLHALTPEPKTVINVDGPHIDGNRLEIVENTVRLARVWLVSKGALNPSR